MPDESLPTWIITGANGFLGANLGAFLEGRARRVGVTRTGDVSSLFDAGIGGTLEQAHELAFAIEQSRPDVVVHAAALAFHDRCEAEPELAQQVNSVAPGVLSQAARNVGARFLHISTDAVFDGATGHYSESDDPRPTSVYGQTKLDGERAVAINPDALVIRTNFFGWSPSGQRSILEFFVNALSSGRSVNGFTDFAVSSAYVSVLCSVLWKLAASDASGLLHATSPDSLTKYAFGVAVAEEFGLDPGLITPTTANVFPPRNGDLGLDVSRLQSLLADPLPTQREGIALAHADATTLRLVIGEQGQP